MNSFEAKYSHQAFHLTRRTLIKLFLFSVCQELLVAASHLIIQLTTLIPPKETASIPTIITHYPGLAYPCSYKSASLLLCLNTQSFCAPESLLWCRCQSLALSRSMTCAVTFLSPGLVLQPLDWSLTLVAFQSNDMWDTVRSFPGSFSCLGFSLFLR